jgi:transposase-like protein
LSQNSILILGLSKNQNKEERIMAQVQTNLDSKLWQGFDDILAVLVLPLKYRKRLRITNSIERLNEKIRRRERVIREKEKIS